MEELIKEIEKLGLTSEQYEECVQLIVDKKVKNIADVDWSEIVQRYNLPFNKDSLRKMNDSVFGGAFVFEYFRLKQLQEQDLKTDEDIQKAINTYHAETEIDKDGNYKSNKLLLMSKDKEKDTIYLLEAHGFDPECWEVVNVKNNIWNVYSKQDGVQQLYASKITVKPRTEVTLKHIERFYGELVSRDNRPIKEFIPTNTDKSYMLEIPIFDLHYNKLALAEEVGEEYNPEIARERFMTIIQEVVEEVSNKNIDRVLFPIGQDFFNTDTVGNTTTGGTAQSNYAGHSKMFDDGCNLIIEGVDYLRTHLINAQIEVFCVNGNHDFMTSYHAVKVVWAYYHNDQQVFVDTDFKARKYVRYGNSLIGFTHGDKEKKRIFGLMQVEAREDWGTTKYHEWHQGHLHSEHLTEENGIIVRNLSSVTGADQWHFNSGYVGAVKKCQCFLWSQDRGLRGIINITF